MKRILWFLLFLYLVFFPLGQLTRIPNIADFPDIRVYITDVLVGVIAFIGAVNWVVGKKRSFPPFSRAMLGFGLVALFSLILSSTNFSLGELAVSALYLLRVVSYGIFLFVVWNIVRAEKEAQLVYASLLLIGVAVAVFGWLQFALFPDIRPLTILGWDEHLFRIVGTFLDPAFTALILVFTLLAFTQRLSRKPTAGLLALWLFVFSALLFTYSRSGFVAALIGLVVLYLRTKKALLFIIPSILLSIGVLVLPRPQSEGVKLERTATIIARVENLRETFSIIKENPLFGVGFNTLRYVRERKEGKEFTFIPSNSAAGIDNSFLFILATTGVVGLLIFSWFLLRLFQYAWPIKFEVNNVFVSSLAALCIHSLFVNSLFYPWVMGWMSILASFLKKKT